jgi:glycogen synthase
MKIVHLTDSYLPTIGGLERSVASLAELQVKEGHDVYVLTSVYPGEPDTTVLNGVKVIRAAMLTQKIPGVLEDPKRPFHPTVRDPLFASSLERNLKAISPDIVHSHGWSLYSLIPVAKKLGIKVLATAHDYGHFCAVKQATMPDGSTCTGPELNKCLAHAKSHYGSVKGVPLVLGLKSNVKASNTISWTGLSESVTTIANGSEFEVSNMAIIPSYTPDSVLSVLEGSRPDFLPEGRYLLFVGAFTHLKGVDVLLEAHKQLQEDGIEIPLVLIGMPKQDSPDFSKYSNITVVENQPHSTVMSAWKHASLGVVPSTMPEAFGQVAVEALAAGTPVIGSNHGGIKDILTEETGVKVPAGDVAAFADAIKALWLDEKRLKDMSGAGPARAALFTVSAVYPRIMQKYQEAIEGNK